MKSITILSGPIGAGKTTVAPLLVASAPGAVVNIEGDVFWWFIVKGDPKHGRKKGFSTIMRSMVAAALPFALSDYEVILDFSIPPWFLETALKIVTPRGVPLDYVVLRPSEEVCAARAASRAEGKISDYGPYRELYTSFDEAERFIVRDDTGDASAVAARIREGLDAGLFRVAT